ncbi:MAG: hypothetical protein HUU37_06650 [Bdellovibrionales bacterium]|nr:hypothetical protein [Bdellovibrionales bacterium]
MRPFLALLLLAGCASTSRDWAAESQDVVRAQGPKLEACHRKHGHGAKGPFGRMEILLRLEGGRSVVSRKKSDLRSKKLERCVLDTFRSASWPRLPEGERFTAEYPVDFRG